MAEKNSKGIFDLSSVYDRVVAGNLPVTPEFALERLNNNTVLSVSGKTFSGYYAPAVEVDYLVVAGGGAGGYAPGSAASGGGGGGGALIGSTTISTFSEITVTIGAGGVAGNPPASGANSVFGSFTAVGGGNGGTPTSTSPASGGSGGGGGAYNLANTQNGAAAGAGGNAGGNGLGSDSSADNQKAGGGGGAGGAGSAATTTVSGKGGDGILSSITGIATYYAGGGSGGSRTNVGTIGNAGSGNTGLGGNATAGSVGRINAGGGGGGSGNGYNGGNGGSGIVVIRHLSRYSTAETTGSPTITKLNGYTIYKFTSSGTIKFRSNNNSNFIDSSTNDLTLTPTGTPTQGSFSPFSPAGYSTYFNGSTDYFAIPSNTIFDFAAGAFTVEMWMYPTSFAIQSVFLNKTANGTSYGMFDWRLNTNGTLLFYGWSGAGGWDFNFTTTIAVNLNAWNHIALTRTSAGVFTMWINGEVGATYTWNYTLTTSTMTFNLGAYPNGTYLYTGYISNFRVSKGVTAYTTKFTPPTAPLTAITGSGLLAFQNNTFKDNSANNITLTPSGTPKILAFSPFSQTTEYNKNVHGGSGYFNGSTDYLITPLSNQFNLTGDFTIECWIYKTNPAADGNGIFGIGSQDPDSNLVRISSGVLQFWLGGSNSGASGTGTKTGIISCSTSIKNYTWYHIALVRSGSATNNVKLYLNGKLDGQGTGTYEIPSNYLVIGRDYPTYSTEYFPGHISNLRVVKGTALYTTTFTPPTAPLTPITNTSLLVKFDNAAIVDSTTENNLVTVGDTKLSTAVTKFNKSAMYFDGTGDYVLIPDATNLLLSGDFTVEAWVYTSSFTGNPTILTIGTEAAGRTIFFFNSDGKIRFDVYGSSGTTGYTTVVPTINTWNHIAFTRSGSVVNGFVNGVLAGTTTGVSTATWGNVTRAAIGADGSLSSLLTGYIDDLRITKGVARYASTFTPTPLEKDKTLALEVLIVAGGGGGGRKRTPGGGAGGLLYYGNNTTTKTPNGPPIIAYSGASYAVAVGLGGATNVSGANSSFGSYVSYGGQGNNSTVIGGSAAGVGTKLWTQGQGQGGGVSANGGYGGGGGAREQGGTGGAIATNTGGYGGNGFSYSEFTAVAGVPAGWFAGGGGGGGLLATAASGGPGGLGGGGYGGNVYGSQTTAYGYNGNAYTGGGGGGTSDVHSSNDAGLGAQGGSGIVIVSYAGTSALATGGTISTTARPGYVCHTFTGAGTFAVT